MNREKLIHELSSHLSPVKRIYPVWITFLLWISFSIFSTLLFVWSQSENFTLVHIPRYFYELSFVFLLIISSTFVAIYTSVPGNRLKGKYRFIPIIFLSLWIFSILLRFFITNEIYVISNIYYHHCMKDIFLNSIPLVSVLIYIMNRRFPIMRNWIGFWVVTASSSTSAIGVAFLCSNEFPLHILLAHIFPVILMGLIGIILGRLIFREKY